MSKAISITNLSKKYRVSTRRLEPYKTIANSATSSTKNTLNFLVNSLSFKKTHTVNQTKDFWALKNINFSVASGERIGIIGHNGAGKSTLLKILSKIIPPTSGSIMTAGRVASLLEVGTGFHPELTGRENVFLNGAILGMSKKEISRKFEEIIYFAEVEKFIDMPVKKYSSGMYVRLAFSVAAHLEPDILVVDEVLAVGDASFQKKCLGRMEESGKEGRTILFVSHNMTTISLLCSKAILLNQGKLTKIGKPDSVINDYLSSRSDGIKISDRQDRTGSGAVKVIDINFMTTKIKSMNRIKSASPFEILVSLKCKPEAIGKSVSITLVVVDRNEFRLLSMHNDVTGKSFRIKESLSKFKCKLPRGLPLIPGTYGLTFAIQISGETADKVMTAFEFEILPSDFYLTGRLPPSYTGSVLVENEWSD